MSVVWGTSALSFKKTKIPVISNKMKGFEWLFLRSFSRRLIVLRLLRSYTWLLLGDNIEDLTTKDTTGLFARLPNNTRVKYTQAAMRDCCLRIFHASVVIYIKYEYHSHLTKSSSHFASFLCIGSMFKLIYVEALYTPHVLHIQYLCNTHATEIQHTCTCNVFSWHVLVEWHQSLLFSLFTQYGRSFCYKWLFNLGRC